MDAGILTYPHLSSPILTYAGMLTYAHVCLVNGMEGVQWRHVEESMRRRVHSSMRSSIDERDRESRPPSALPPGGGVTGGGGGDVQWRDTEWRAWQASGGAPYGHQPQVMCHECAQLKGTCRQCATCHEYAQVKRTWPQVSAPRNVWGGGGSMYTGEGGGP